MKKVIIDLLKKYKLHIIGISILLIIIIQYFNPVKILIFSLKHLAFRLEKMVFALVELEQGGFSGVIAVFKNIGCGYYTGFHADNGRALKGFILFLNSELFNPFSCFKCFEIAVCVFVNPARSGPQANLGGNGFEKAIRLGYWSGVAQLVERELEVISGECGAAEALARLTAFVNLMLERSKDES